ncbi:ABC transporter ATP-binding protein [Vineibacter terrae]|uniref:ABC transporter ATP-binding protein n=1 Tax=Vineibacter terrae TaxID=2586908 RepID=UPI002E3199B0|nr:ABC transporter ATP-binding protein [Vineibacter terrae]HEX2888338.1 ABC transporter ATP-binding protein [Vineibacter terrae]
MTIRFKNRSFADAELVLDVRDLTVGLPGSPDAAAVLNGVSLHIRAGETACVVGESGSGKSVTSLSIMGLLPRGSLAATGGSIGFEGRNLLDLGPAALRQHRARKISMIFQEPMTALNPLMRVGEQIEEVLEAHTALPARDRRERVLDMLRQVHLPDIERIHVSYPHQLSGGQRQRIMIAMALILEPRLLIADEPTTALDVTTQKQILGLIDELQQRHGTAVLFITHDMGVVADIADTVHVMKQGRIVESGAVETVLRQPRDDYTRQLLRAVPSLTPRVARQAPADAAILTVRGLQKAYGQPGIFSNRRPLLAAQEIGFVVHPGRTLGIVGESGSGKSTVARCVVRLIEPTAGEIRIAGTDIAPLSRRALKPHRKHVQIVFQDPFRSLNPRWTIARSLIEGPRNLGIGKDAALARATELLTLVGMPRDTLQRFPHQFSGGQRQRIAIARALAMEPDLLVADEAVSGLDVSVQAQVLALLGDLQAKLGIAILFITHDLRVAAQICDEVMVMEKGRIVEHDTAANVLLHPQHDYTRALIGAAPGRGWDFANFRALGQVGA